MSSSVSTRSSVQNASTIVLHEDDSQTVPISSTSSSSTVPVTMDVGPFNPNNQPAHQKPPDKLIKFLDEFFDSYAVQFKKALKIQVTKGVACQELDTHQTNGTFPQDLSFKFNAFTQLPHSISEELREEARSADLTAFRDFQNGCLSRRRAYLEADLKVAETNVYSMQKNRAEFEALILATGATSAISDVNFTQFMPAITQRIVLFLARIDKLVEEGEQHLAFLYARALTKKGLTPQQAADTFAAPANYSATEWAAHMAAVSAQMAAMQLKLDKLEAPAAAAPRSFAQAAKSRAAAPPQSTASNTARNSNNSRKGPKNSSGSGGKSTETASNAVQRDRRPSEDKNRRSDSRDRHHHDRRDRYDRSPSPRPSRSDSFRSKRQHSPSRDRDDDRSRSKQRYDRSHRSSSRPPRRDHDHDRDFDRGRSHHRDSRRDDSRERGSGPYRH